MKKLLLVLLVVYSSCSSNSGTSTGNPLVVLNFKSFSPLTAQDIGAQSVSNLKMCFKRLRFKPVTGLDENIDLVLDEVSISASGILVTTASIPVGTYSRVEFDLDTHCASGKSVQLTNTTGTFNSLDTITIRFDGTFVHTASQNLDLNIQSIVSALNTVNSDADIKLKAQSVSGNF